jgi:hypothetical protein
MADANSEDKFVPKSGDEVRQEVVEEFGFDAEADSERIDKLTAERLDHQEKLSTAIKQKKSQREARERHEAKLRELGFDPETGEKTQKTEEKRVESKTDDSPLRERLDKTEKELDEIRMGQVGEFSEEIQKEIRLFAKMNNVSYREAAKSDYVKFRVGQEDEKSKNEEAALGGSNANRRVGGKRLSEVKPENVRDLNDEDFAKWKKQNLKAK